MFGRNLEKSSSVAWRLALAGSVLALTACQDATAADETVRDDAGNVVEEGDVGVFVMQVGDCYADQAVGLVESLTAIPCADQHEMEVFAKFELPVGDYPGKDVVDTAADEGCLAEFTGYVGIDYADSIYYYSFLSPTEDGWNRIDDREIVCVLTVVGDDPNTGTARGSQI